MSQIDYDANMTAECRPDAQTMRAIKLAVVRVLAARGVRQSLSIRESIHDRLGPDIDLAIEELELEGVIERETGGRWCLIADYEDVTLPAPNRREIEALEIVALRHTPNGEVHARTVRDKVGNEAFDACVSMQWLHHYETMVVSMGDGGLVKLRPQGWAVLHRHWRKRK